jgi:type I restriction enzyme R subunit
VTETVSSSTGREAGGQRLRHRRGSDAARGLGGHERRPDLVLYVNGIAMGVLELKNSRTSASATASGRTCRTSSRSSTPGSSARCSSSLRATTPRAAVRHHRHAGEVLPEVEGRRGRQQPLQARQVPAEDVRKARLIELMHDFVLFDGGVKKLPRVHQYFGIKAAQEHVRQRKGGIIWHTQGSGQEHRDGAAGQVDPGEQPAGAGGDRHRPRRTGQADRARVHRSRRAHQPHQQRARPDEPAGPGHAAAAVLAGPQVRAARMWTTSTPSSRTWRPAQPRPWARCSCSSTNATAPRAASCTSDEGADAGRGVHRLHRHAAAEAGRQTSREVFGGYIHTYKFSEAVEDGWCSTWCTRRATSSRAWARRTRSTSGSTPRPRA